MWQEQVGQVWADVLGLERIDPGEGFVELGGDSLATEEMLTRPLLLSMRMDPALKLMLGHVRALTSPTRSPHRTMSKTSCGRARHR